MTNIFIDTSAFYASLDKKDVNHNAAAGLFRDIKSGKILHPVISSFIFCESVTLIRSKLGIDLSIKFGMSLRESRKILNIPVTHDIEEKAWEIFSTHTDKNYSFVDCTSFAIMRKRGIQKVFSFDRHFEQFGFEVLPLER